ncbi:MAG: T9SS type A sorting domain-containing protein [Candidatus Cyclobacteriaceae bacterium M3_2C_046]
MRSIILFLILWMGCYAGKSAIPDNIFSANAEIIPWVYENQDIRISQLNINNQENYSTLNYEIRKKDLKATLKIYNVLGRLLKVYELPEDKKVLKINNQTFSRGVYIYSVYIDQHELFTKKLTFS